MTDHNIYQVYYNIKCFTCRGSKWVTYPGCEPKCFTCEIHSIQVWRDSVAAQLKSHRRRLRGIS